MNSSHDDHTHAGPARVVLARRRNAGTGLTSARIRRAVGTAD
jgi:hypothetical protein